MARPTFMSRLWSSLRRAQVRAGKDRRAEADLWRQVAELRHASAVLDLARRRSIFRPEEHKAPANQRVLVIAPHPDDEAIGPGGTLALARQRDCPVSVVYVTSQGFPGAEARVAEAVLGCARQGFEPVFLPFVPGRIPLSGEAAGLLGKAIANFRPDIVFLPFFLDDHDDHRRTLQLLLEASGQATDSWRFAIWAYQVYSGAALPAVVDITKAEAAKREAIACYASEMRKRDWVHYALGQNAAASRFLRSSAERRYAELFYISNFADYAALLAQYFAAGSCYHDSYLEE